MGVISLSALISEALIQKGKKGTLLTYKGKKARMFTAHSPHHWGRKVLEITDFFQSNEREESDLCLGLRVGLVSQLRLSGAQNRKKE